jgi:hypothetical protein
MDFKEWLENFKEFVEEDLKVELPFVDDEKDNPCYGYCTSKQLNYIAGANLDILGTRFINLPRERVVELLKLIQTKE